MDKKALNWYESPKVEIVELEVEAQIMAGSVGSARAVEGEEENEEEFLISSENLFC